MASSKWREVVQRATLKTRPAGKVLAPSADTLAAAGVASRGKKRRTDSPDVIAVKQPGGLPRKAKAPAAPRAALSPPAADEKAAKFATTGTTRPAPRRRKAAAAQTSVPSPSPVVPEVQPTDIRAQRLAQIKALAARPYRPAPSLPTPAVAAERPAPSRPRRPPARPARAAAPTSEALPVAVDPAPLAESSPVEPLSVPETAPAACLPEPLPARQPDMAPTADLMLTPSAAERQVDLIEVLSLYVAPALAETAVVEALGEEPVSGAVEPLAVAPPVPAEVVAAGEAPSAVAEALADLPVAEVLSVEAAPADLLREVVQGFRAEPPSPELTPPEVAAVAAAPVELTTVREAAMLRTTPPLPRRPPPPRAPAPVTLVGWMVSKIRRWAGLRP